MTPKFRAWHKELGRMMLIEIMYFFFFDNELEELELNDPVMNDHISVYPDEIVLMQSTGLKDKNGKEIFEGDILCDEGIEQENEFVYVTVSYREGMWVCDQITDELCGYGGALNEFSNDYSILGNIYENPELLEDKG